MDLLEALHVCGGAASTGRLSQLDVAPSAIRAARRNGLHLGRGRFALPEAPPPFIAAVRLGGVVSHSSAATIHGFDPWRKYATLHITVPSGSRISEADVCIHRARLTPHDVDPRRPLTTPFRTVVDCARTMPLIDAVVIMDAALHGGRVKRDQLRAAADSARGFGASALRQAVAYADELADSALESVLRVLVSILNCKLRSQVRFPGMTPVDFVVDGWLVIEADGYEFHSNRSSYRKDRNRANRLAELGLVLLRFTWEDLRFGPGRVLAQVARVLAAGPPRGFGKS